MSMRYAHTQHIYCYNIMTRVYINDVYTERLFICLFILSFQYNIILKTKIQ